MITFNQTIGDDKDLLYFIKIYFDDVVYKICRHDNIISNYKASLREGISLDINSVYLSIDKGFCFSGDLRLEFPRYLLNDYFSAFQNALAPASNKSQWLNRKVEIGIGWSGIYQESQITWIYFGYIKDYSITYDTLIFDISNSIDDIEIPTETINRDEFPYCPEENVGKVKPIIFGKLDYCFLFFDDAMQNRLFNYMNLAQALLVDNIEGIYYISQHQTNILPTAKRLHREDTYIDNLIFLVFYDTASKGYIAVHNNALSNNYINSNYYAIRIRANGSNNDYRAYFKYKPLKQGLIVNQKIFNLMKRNAGYEYEIFGSNSQFSLELDNLSKNLYGYLSNDNVALVLHTAGSSSDNLEVRLYHKESQTPIGYYIVRTMYPKTYLLYLLPQENQNNCELQFRVLQNRLLYLSNFYFIGWDLIYPNRELT